MRKLIKPGPSSKWWIGTKEKFDWVVEKNGTFWIIPRQTEKQVPKETKLQPKKKTEQINLKFYWTLVIALSAALGISLGLNIFKFL
jgi:hypothetical protein